MEPYHIETVQNIPCPGQNGKCTKLDLNSDTIFVGKMVAWNYRETTVNFAWTTFPIR